MSETFTLRVNGADRAVPAEPSTPLVHLLALTRSWEDYPILRSNAAAHALGVRAGDLPLTPERVAEAME